MSPRRLAVIALLAVLVAIVWWRSHRFDATHQPHDPSAPQVPLVAVRSGSAPVTLGAVGNVVSPHTVNIRAQLSGTLQQIYFHEGDEVRAGQKLFLIEPAPYQAALAQARAQLAVDRAALSAARAQFERMKPLIDKEYVTSQEFDDARAAADEAAARVLADEAAVRGARINLGYTEIRAPIDGRTGSIGAKTGNLVSSSDALPLVVIKQIDPVQVQFALPQTQLAAIQQALGRGTVPVSVLGDGGERPLATGKLDFIENAVDTSTGTVTLKALIDNPEHRLWPGAFVNVRVQLAVDDHALLVPESAVQPGADGQYVFVVGADGRTALRTIRVERQIGSELVVGSGLKAGEIIVAQIPHNLQPGTMVRAIDAPAAKAPGGSPP